MNILDQYVTRAPTQQNILDLFDGEWSSMMPTTSGLTTRPGTAALFEDGRIAWAEQQFGGFNARRILELGPLECGHTYMLHERGAESIVSIEANTTPEVPIVTLTIPSLTIPAPHALAG